MSGKSGSVATGPGEIVHMPNGQKVMIGAPERVGSAGKACAFDDAVKCAEEIDTVQA